MMIKIATNPTTIHFVGTRFIEEILPDRSQIEIAGAIWQSVFGMLVKGLQLPGPHPTANSRNLKLNNTGLASSTMLSRSRAGVMLTVNFTP
jgi:hypothetical protein